MKMIITRIVTLIASLIAILSIASLSLESKDYWGLRNIDLKISNSEYNKYDPKFIAVGTSWNRIENPDNNWNWASIDDMIDFALVHNSTVVLVLEPESSWASDNEAKAPYDLNRIIPLDDVPERGFSEALYDYAYSITERFMQADTNLLKYVRYVGEPQYYNLDPPHWIATKETYKQDIDDYLRCLRTVYKAVHKAAEDYGTDIKVSHGGLYYDDQLIREWYQYGQANPDSQDSLIAQFRSRYERHWQQSADSWSDIERRVNRNSDLPPCYWMDVMAGQTEWLDFFDVHHHWKPQFIFDELGAFENQVLDSGGTLKPWFSSETAFQLNEDADTQYDERFHAADMVRKWTLGMAFGLVGTCTPIMGQPPDRFFGLYDTQGNEYLSAQSYRFLRSVIQPKENPFDLSLNNIKYYRFNEEDRVVDVLWLSALFDKQVSEEILATIKPDGYGLGTVYDILGNKIDVVSDGNLIHIYNEPKIIVWSKTEDNILRKYEPPNGYVYHGVGWNYRNSVESYLEMMPNNQQPLMFQTMFAIPGTRGVTVNKVVEGLNPANMDTSQQYIEFGVHFHKTQDEPYDSLFAFTDEMDHLIDSLAIAMKIVNRPFFLRIGGEINGAWNNYTPYTFPKAYRKLVLGLRDRGVNNFASVWCYEPAAPADFADSTYLGWKWYPGDDVVDWFGLDVFPADDFDPDEPDSLQINLTKKGRSELFLKFAEERRFPVYINETTSHSENLTPDSEDPDQIDGQNDWEHWFVPFFEFLAIHPNIKAFNYINLDWTPIDKWTNWGDCRLEVNSFIKENWIEKLKEKKFIHAGFDIEDQELEPDFAILYPNGGEQFYIGEEFDILWRDAPFEKLSIDFSIDNGIQWNNIINDLESSLNKFSWLVPNQPSDECLIRITNSENQEEYDMSDNTFSIIEKVKKSITLITPNGGEIWQSRDKRKIEWESSGIDFIRAEFSFNNGNTWWVINRKIFAPMGNYEWTIPDTNSNVCLFRIKDYYDDSVFDQCDATFSVLPITNVNSNIENDNFIQVIPNPVNNNAKIMVNLDFIGEVNIYLLDYTGKVISVIFEGESTNLMSFEFKSDNLSSGSYFIRLEYGDNAILRKLLINK